MEILKDAADLGTIQRRMLRVEVTHCTMVGEEITATKELRSEINVTIILEKTIVTELFAVHRTQES